MIALADYNNPDDAYFRPEGPDVFVAREQELAYLNSLLKPAGRLSGQLVLLYGRRRVGKPQRLNNPRRSACTARSLHHCY